VDDDGYKRRDIEFFKVLESDKSFLEQAFANEPQLDEKDKRIKELERELYVLKKRRYKVK